MTDPQFPPPTYAPPPAGAAGPSPAYQAPPGAYAAPVGGYAAPVGGYRPPEPAAAKPATMGVIAFILSLIAAVASSIMVGIAAYEVGFALPSVADRIDQSTSDLAFLSPVRDQVLMGEIAFWIGTLAGIAAIVLGIIAIVKRQGLAWGVTALIVAGLGPVIFFVVFGMTLTAGAAAGAVTAYSA